MRNKRTPKRNELKIRRNEDDEIERERKKKREEKIAHNHRITFALSENKRPGKINADERDSDHSKQ